METATASASGDSRVSFLRFSPLKFIHGFWSLPRVPSPSRRITVVILLRPEAPELNNLRNVTAKITKGVLTVVTGVAGSGKSSLIHGCLVPLHPDAVVVDQALTPGSRRSNLATYSGMADAIRKAFATANKEQPALFSANSKGACPACEGLGVINTDLQHMDPVATRCEACEGRCSPTRFSR